MLPLGLGALQEQVPLHLGGEEDLVGQLLRLHDEIRSAAGPRRLAVVDGAGTERGGCGSPGGWARRWGWAEPRGASSSGICGGAGVALRALGAHLSGLRGGARSAPGLPGTRWALGTGWAVNSFCPPSILCRCMVPSTASERDNKIFMVNLMAFMRSCLKNKLFHPVHLHLSHLQQPWVEVMGIAQASVLTTGPMLRHGQCSGLPAQAKGPWGCSYVGDTMSLAAGCEHGGGTSHVLLVV